MAEAVLLEFRIAAKGPHPSLKGMEVVAALLRFGTVVDCKPDILEGSPDSPEIRYAITLQPPSSLEAARAEELLSADAELADVKLGAPHAVPSPEEPARETVVRVERLHVLERQASDVVAALGRIGRFLDGLDAATGEARSPGRVAEGRLSAELAARLKEARQAYRQTSAMAQRLRDSARGLLLVPAGKLLARLPRPVRDLARELGKQVRFSVAGEDTELEQSVLDELREPLLHLVRNAVGHGLETPEERLDSGKPAAGMLRVEAYVAGDNFVLDVADDGRGLDPRRLGLRALQMRLVSPDALSRMTDTQIQSFIYSPGFSTAASVSTLSGRGLGMDVVKSRIVKLHGTIELASRPGEGTSFSIRVPLAASLIRALLVETAGTTLAVPASAIRSVGPVRDWTAGRAAGAPLVSLAGALGWGDRAPTRVVEVGVAERRIGLGVEACLDHEELAVRPLAKVFGHVPGIGGAAILPNGRPVLVLDTAELADQIGV